MLVAVNLAVVYVVFGSTYLAIRVMVETIPPLVGAGVRFAAAGLLLLVWCALRRGRLPRLDARSFGGTALIGLLIIGGALGLLTLGEESVPSGLAALLIASTPAWVLLLRAGHREAVGWLSWTGAAVGLAGVALLGGLSGGAAVAGIAILLAAAVCEAVGTYYTPRFSLPQDPVFASAVQMAVSGPVLVAAGAARGEDISPGEWTGQGIWALLYLIGPGSLLAYSSFVWLASRTSASVTSTYTYVNPAVALFLGWLVLDERITPAIGAGAVLVTAGVAVLLAGEARDRAE